MKTIVACAALLALSFGVASADDREKADDLFKQAKKLMADKRYADACAKFEESYKLDPGIGGELNIAKCFEEWGKLGRAYKAYKAAEDQARKAHDKRRDQIHDLVVQIEPLVPKLMIRVPADGDASGLVLTLDGTRIEKESLGNAQLVDPGPKVIEYSVGGGPKKSRIVPVERGGTSEVVLELPLKKSGDKGDKTERGDKGEEDHAPEAEDPGKMWKLGAYVAGGVGVVMIGVASYMTLSARSKYNDALGAHCMGMTNTCDPQGLQITHDARHEANIATIVFSVGVAAVGGGVALYLLAPKARPATDEHAWYLVPSVTPDGGGLVFGGRL